MTTCDTKKQTFILRILRNFLHIVSVTVIGGILSACDTRIERSMEVTATAYTLRQAETKKGHKGLSAWGDQLKPGMKSIAVSRDLIKLGLRHEAEVKIVGFEGTYIVRDKMNKRWKRRIDIFMGNNVNEAREWGKRKVVIRWSEEKND